jgi:hypothetical protein
MFRAAETRGISLTLARPGRRSVARYRPCKTIVATAPASSAPRCSPSQLTATAALTPAGAGNDLYRITIVDRGTPCTLRARPGSLVGVATAGRHRRLHPSPLSADWVRAALSGKPANLDHTHSADVLLVTGIGCDGGRHAPRPSTGFRSLLLGVDGASIRVRYLGGPEPIDHKYGVQLGCGVAMSDYAASFPAH